MISDPLMRMILLEQYLIKALIKDKRLIPEVQETFDPTELSHPISQKILEELFVYGDKTDFEAKIFDTFQGAEVQQELSELLMNIQRRNLHLNKSSLRK